MTVNLWMLQVLKDEGWRIIKPSAPMDEIEDYLTHMLYLWKGSTTQRYYRALCLTDETAEPKSWQALPDFPDFDHWHDVGTVAVMKDGSMWRRV